MSGSRGQRCDDSRVVERGSQAVVFLVEGAACVRERLGAGSGFVTLEAVATRAFPGGGKVPGEVLDPRLRPVGMVSRFGVSRRVAPRVDDR